MSIIHLSIPSLVTEDAEMILGTIPGEKFYGEDGSMLILTDEGRYAIRVDPSSGDFNNGDPVTHSAYLVTVPPADIAEALHADEGEISGWSTGWEC